MDITNTKQSRRDQIDSLSIKLAVLITFTSIILQLLAPSILYSTFFFALMGLLNFLLMALSYQHLPDPNRSKIWMYFALVFFNIYTLDPLLHQLNRLPLLFLAPVCLTLGHLLGSVHVEEELRKLRKVIGYSGYILDVNIIFVSCLIIPLLAFSDVLMTIFSKSTRGEATLLVVVIFDTWWLITCLLAYSFLYIRRRTKLFMIGITAFATAHFLLLYLMYNPPNNIQPLDLAKMSFICYGICSSLTLLYSRCDNSKFPSKPVIPSANILKVIFIFALTLIVSAIPISVLIASSRGNKVSVIFLLIATLISLIIIGVRMLVTVYQYSDHQKLAQNESLTDNVTGLYNLFGLFETFDFRKKPSIVATFSINNFKMLKKIHGHFLWDEILCQFATELTNVSQTFALENNAQTALARIEGNDLVLVVWDYYSCDYFSQYFSQHIEQWWSIDQFSIFINYSFGVSPYSDSNFTTRINEASFALAEARTNRSKVLPPHQIHWNKPLILEENSNLIREAIEGNNIRIHFQPVYIIRTGALQSYEALTRLFIQDRLILPQDFLEVVDKEGLTKLLAFAIFRALAKCKPMLPNIPIAVNISAALFKDPDVINWILSSFKQFELNINDFTFEISNIGTIENSILFERIAQLTRLGVKIALDNYGSNHLVLSKLNAVPIHYLKIDRALLLEAVKGNTALIEIAISTANAHGYITTAQGVENTEQLILVQKLKIDRVQGWLTGKPTEAKEIQKYYKQNPYSVLTSTLLKTVNYTA